jgi:MFS family permease
MTNGATPARAAAVGGSIVLLTLAVAQFLMILDSSVMNVSIATVAEDVGTTVTGIQTAITLYMLVMASLTITGGRIGSILSDAQLEEAFAEAGVGEATTEAILDDNAQARIDALRAALAVLAVLVSLAFFFSGGIPQRAVGRAPEGAAESADEAPGQEPAPA